MTGSAPDGSRDQGPPAAEEASGERGEGGAKRRFGHSLLGDLYDLVQVVALAIAAAFLIRIVLFQPFNIPTGSMIPSLLIGDYLFISKYSYGYSRYSLPFRLPLFEGRLFGAEPERGDVVVFHFAGVDYIKRLVGLPGDRVQMRGGRLYINEAEVARRPLAPLLTRDLYGYDREIPRYEEVLPNGRRYETLDLIENGAGDTTKAYLVPTGHYFMLGDNRDNSSDSRFSAPIGFVPAENLIGKAQFLYFSKAAPPEDRNAPRKDGFIRWERLLKAVR